MITNVITEIYKRNEKAEADVSWSSRLEWKVNQEVIIVWFIYWIFF
jgi:hypothetical protein